MTICWVIKLVSNKKSPEVIFIHHDFSYSNVINVEVHADIDITRKSPNMYKSDGIFVVNPWVKTQILKGN